MLIYLAFKWLYASKGNTISGAIMGVSWERRNIHIGVSSERRNVHIVSSELRNVHNDCSHVDGRG